MNSASLRRLVLGLLLASAPLGAAENHESEEQVPLRYERLDLRDGRKLTNVEVKYYDPDTDRFYLVAERSALIVAAALVPQPLADRLREDAPLKAANAEPDRPAEPPPPAPDRSAEPNSRTRDAVVAPDPTAAHFAAAESRATRYYRYEHQTGSNNIRVTALDFEWSDPVEVAGWPNRYRTSGKALLEYWDSRTRQFHRTTSEFEVTTELKPEKRSIEIADFSRKN